ncbi:MAG: HYExAFE family protein [Planctomycetes bacterium]|nr:HYExAFE family protein [Planctomycetota bacterium]
MDRSNPYEAAFEAYLKAQNLCYVAVDETRRAFLGPTSVKNLDFIVLASSGARLLVDVKGRQFPGGSAGKERYVWENWSTQEDIDGLVNWTRVFGPGSLGLFVFLYRIGPSVSLPADTPDLWRWRDCQYLLRAVPLVEYRRRMKVRSPRWGTVALSHPVFRELARPFRYYTHEFTPEDTVPYGPDADWLEPFRLEPTLAASPCGSAEA